MKSNMKARREKMAAIHDELKVLLSASFGERERELMSSLCYELFISEIGFQKRTGYE